MSVSVGGYEIDGITVRNKHGAMTKIDLEHLMCPLCNKILRGAVQVIVCGHRYCKECLDGFVEKSKENTLRCPEDGVDFTLNHARMDKGCQKEVAALMVDCPSKPKPCSWQGFLTQVEEHMRDCPNAILPCEFQCGAMVPQSQMVSHKQQCPMRLTSCIYCKQPFPHNSMEAHYVSCECCPVKCEYCNAEIAQRKQYTAHLEYDCQDCEITCPSKVPPCEFKGKRAQMQLHLTEVHLIQMFDTVSMLTIHNQQLRQDMKSEFQLIDTDVKSQNEALQFGKQRLYQDFRVQTKKVDDLTQRLDEVERYVRYERNDAVEMDSGFARDGATFGRPRLPSIQASDAAASASRARGTHAGTVKVSQEVVALQGDLAGHRLVRMADNVLVLQESRSPQAASTTRGTRTEKAKENQEIVALQEDIAGHRAQLVQMVENVQVFQETVSQQTIAVDEVRLRQDVLEVKTNGIFLWKIPDVRRRYRDAVERKTLSLYSPPFYTSPHGYRMCIRAYLNGDGIGKGTHISVFFVLMRSEHDSLLSWPFKQSVRFTLINQKNPGNSHSEAFIPDLKSASFQRPQNEMNIASGFPKFVRKSVLQDENFTLGNTLVIKAQVD